MEIIETPHSIVDETIDNWVSFIKGHSSTHNFISKFTQKTFRINKNKKKMRHEIWEPQDVFCVFYFSLHSYNVRLIPGHFMYFLRLKWLEFVEP